MSAARYGGGAIALHWLQAVLVLGLLILGWTMVDLPKGPDKTWAFALHKSLGQCALLLIWVRIFWRRRHPPVPLNGWEARLALLTHRLMYVLLVVVPMAGYLSASFTKYPMKFFGVPMPKVGWPDEGVNGVFNSVHKFSVVVLAVLIGMHLVGVVYHLVRRDGRLGRMLPM